MYDTALYPCPDTDTERYPITVTRGDIIAAGACPEGIAAFDDVVPGGVLTIADVAAHVALLDGPLGPYEGRAVAEGLLPPIHATAGCEGRARAGYWGYAMAGAWGMAAVGTEGTATVGVGGRAMAGTRGVIQIDWYDPGSLLPAGGGHTRTAVGWVGESVDWVGSVLEAGTMYAVDSQGRFFRA